MGEHDTGAARGGAGHGQKGNGSGAIEHDTGRKLKYGIAVKVHGGKCPERRGIQRVLALQVS